jgi:hypothetical protein
VTTRAAGNARNSERGACLGRKRTENGGDTGTASRSQTDEELITTRMEVREHHGRNESPERLLTVADVARWLSLGEHWVREHAAELGGVKIGDDPRSPLRFARVAVEEWIEEHRLRAPAGVPATPTETAERVKLLPLPGERP